MSADWPWSELGLEGPVDARTVKRAYAKTLKSIDRNDPVAFQSLRDAFSYAKDIAADEEPAAPKKPSVAELMGGHSPSHPMPDLSNIKVVEEPAQPEEVPKLAPSQPEELSAVDPIAVEEPAQPEEMPELAPSQPEELSVVDPIVVEEPDFQTAPETESTESYAPPPPPKPLLWSDRITDLPSLFDSDPIQTRHKFWQHLNKTLKRWPIDTGDLSSLLNLPFLDRDMRRSAEIEIYDSISRHLDEGGSVVLPRELSELLEEEFAWGSDGVGLSHRLGWRQDFHEVLYSFSLGLPASAQPQVIKKRQPKANRIFLYYKAGIFGLLWLVTLSTQPISSGGELVVQLIALAIFFAMVHYAMTFIYPIIWSLLKLTRVDTLLRAVFPVLVNSIDTTEEEANLFQFALSAIALGVSVSIAG